MSENADPQLSAGDRPRRLSSPNPGEIHFRTSKGSSIMVLIEPNTQCLTAYHRSEVDGPINCGGRQIQSSGTFFITFPVPALLDLVRDQITDEDMAMLLAHAIRSAS